MRKKPRCWRFVLDRSEARRATRETIISEITVSHARRGDPLFPNIHPRLAEEEADEAWTVFLTTRTGLQPTQINAIVFTEKEALDGFLSKTRVGQALTDSDGALTFEGEATESFQKRLVKDIIAPNSPLRVSAGDQDSPLAYEVLGDAGIYAKSYGHLSEEVKESLGQERIDALKNSIGETWEIAAAFEYCWTHLPHSSPAFVAACYRFHYYITEDYFSAGYHWRDLEVLVHGVEQTATKAINRSKKAGQSGSKRSAQARDFRRASIMEAIEEICAKNPDLPKLGADTASRLALEVAIEKDPMLWSQGKGQTQEYLGEIRRGEAGQDLHERYVALFGSKPPRRL